MGPVEQHKKELCKQAYLLIHKYLAAAGKEGQESFDFRKNIRKKDALDIDMATNKEVIAEVSRFKEQGGLAALLASGGGGTYVAASGAKASKKGASTPGAAASSGAGLPPLAPAAKGSAKPSRSKGGKDGTSSPPNIQLPSKLGAKVNRWWANEKQWYTAVVTDYNADTNLYRLTYNLSSSQETYEDFDLDGADPAIYELTGETMNLLAMTGSAAVNNSVVLQPYLARAGVAGGGGGGGTKSGSKKRRSEDDDSDDDF
ncbi:hypothetical protein CHLRE_05g237350v5 [Chlamydomonas reinhardtii]|uniref:Tudor domain-containing protein n=1 Tax=Chlamydomonas reinhardtii TaxID=3055 RepID=A0A2K3DSV9_CHLRE|nr:uncharacterized protein CHLRE_05g237350v5 [Chlamydomonas reinhardtii]PNW83626.1 hypothetical protein CHLRE_05g237350v5 [Chlamydomonas reinhardtii]